MALASTSVHMVEQAPQNGCCQFLYPQGELQGLLPLREALQDQQVGLMQAPFKFLPLPWVPGHVKFCVCLLRVVSLFPTAIWLSRK